MQTQPIYDLEQAKRYIDKMSEFDVPIMLGLIPLKSFKMATYLMKKCLESTLPQEILDRMEKGGKEGYRNRHRNTNKSRKSQQAYILCLLNDIDTTLHIIDHV